MPGPSREEMREEPRRLEPMLVRLPLPLAAELRQLARVTRVRQSDYLREAVADLLAKYGRTASPRTVDRACVG